MAMARVSGVLAERIEIAAFGPTPETPIRSSKLRFSLFDQKPLRSKQSSRIYS
jgi:hypothetical protein